MSDYVNHLVSMRAIIQSESFETGQGVAAAREFDFSLLSASRFLDADQNADLNPLFVGVLPLIALSVAGVAAVYVPYGLNRFHPPSQQHLKSTAQGMVSELGDFIEKGRDNRVEYDEWGPEFENFVDAVADLIRRLESQNGMIPPSRPFVCGLIDVLEVIRSSFIEYLVAADPECADEEGDLYKALVGPNGMVTNALRTLRTRV